MTQAGGLLGQAAGSLNNAAAKLTTPAAQALPQAQFPAAQGFQPVEMGRIVLDLRFPNGKELSGILFGTKEFLTKFKAQTETNVRDMLLGVRDAVR